MKHFGSFDEFKEFATSLRPMDVERFVYDIFVTSKKFVEIELNPIINHRQIDITLYEINDSPIGSRVFWAVEIKSYKGPVPINVVDAFYGKLLDLQSIEPNSKLLIVSTSGYTRSAIEKAERSGMFLWGLNELYSLYCNNPPELTTPEPPLVVENEGLVGKSEALKNALNGIEPGKKNWSKYQSLVVDILEFILCPPLESPRVELADSDKRNRRDIIFENSSSDGFWRVVRDIYQGHYIVVDAKNYTNTLSKRPVLDISHYLKPYGCGMFSIIISRKGYGAAGKHAAKEQWIGNRKMIIALSDDDLVKMLDLKKQGLSPEEVIKNHISEFRMSL